MSIFSDHELGYTSDEEFDFECARMNREDRADRERLPFEPSEDDLFSDYPDMPYQFDNMTGSMNL